MNGIDGDSSCFSERRSLIRFYGSASEDDRRVEERDLA